MDLIPLRNQNPSYPLDGNPHIYQPFTLDQGPWGHVGIDWDVRVGSNVRAVLNSRALWTVDDSMVYGRFIGLIHEDGCLSLYAHLAKILIKKGDQVTGGQIIGLSGGDPFDNIDGDGKSTGYHLHFEIRVPGHWEHNKFNVDPLKYIKSYMDLENQLLLTDHIP